jgi:hypothetical protein
MMHSWAVDGEGADGSEYMKLADAASRHRVILHLQVYIRANNPSL